MSTFLWTIIWCFSVELLVKFMMLAIGHVPPRTPFSLVIDAIFMVCFIVWAAVLLA